MTGDPFAQRAHLCFRLGRDLVELRYRAERAWLSEDQPPSDGPPSGGSIQAMRATAARVVRSVTELIQHSDKKIEKEKLKDLRKAVSTGRDAFTTAWNDDEKRM